MGGVVETVEPSVGAVITGAAGGGCGETTRVLRPAWKQAAWPGVSRAWSPEHTLSTVLSTVPGAALARGVIPTCSTRPEPAGTEPTSGTLSPSVSVSGAPPTPRSTVKLGSVPDVVISKVSSRKPRFASATPWTTRTPGAADCCPGPTAEGLPRRIGVDEANQSGRGVPPKRASKIACAPTVKTDAVMVQRPSWVPETTTASPPVSSVPPPFHTPGRPSVPGAAVPSAAP
jgi:hypothetical protein